MNSNPFSLRNKTILITGASSGIGREIAIQCDSFGANTILIGRDEQRLLETYKQLKNESKFYLYDLTDFENFSKLGLQKNSIDGVVFCAGIERPVPTQYINYSEISDTFNINSFSPILLTNYLVKLKILNNNSSLVLISSIAGNNCSMVGGALYSSSKAALNGFCKGAALDLAKRNIRINCINPGLISTDLSKSILLESNETIITEYPLGKLGDTSDVAYGAIYLLSDVSKWVTGTSIVIDGGFTLK